MCPDIPRVKTFCCFCAKIGFSFDLFISMDIFEISAPLVLSCTLRTLVDHNNIAILADNRLIVFFVQWKPYFWTTLLITLSILIGFALYETRAEGMCSKGNVRGKAPDNLTEHRGFSSTASSYPSASNLKSDMCPVKSFRIPRITANTHHHLQDVTSEANRKTTDGFWRETNAPRLNE
jgi:hypothetical protein